MSEAEYLAFEEASPTRHEFAAGGVFAMDGVSQRHNHIASNLAIVLMTVFRDKPCQVFMSDVKLNVANDNAYYYPDVMATRAEPAVAANESQVVTDPVLIIEVLSPGTETIDRREKLHAYRHLPALQEYALISQDQQQVETIADKVTLVGFTSPMNLATRLNSSASARHWRLQSCIRGQTWLKPHDPRLFCKSVSRISDRSKLLGSMKQTIGLVKLSGWSSANPVSGVRCLQRPQWEGHRSSASQSARMAA